MNAEAGTQAAKIEELNFDAHEFDGLREAGRRSAATWLRQADRFVKENPWLCVGIAAAVALAAGMAIAPRRSKAECEDTD